MQLISCATISENAAQINFLIGGSHFSQMENLQCRISSSPKSPFSIDMSQQILYCDQTQNEQEGFRARFSKKVGAFLGFGLPQEVPNPVSTINREVKQLILVKNAENTAHDSVLILSGSQLI